MPKISVIIPCFNQGPYLDEAVDSVLAQTFQDFEILVVDDGSTDVETVKILQDYARPKTRVIHTDNQGLSMARNNGIREALGVYILPLDADDKIGDGYLEDAVRILDRYPEIGIVYCEASYFGVKGGRWDLPEYTLDKILNHNVIFCTALFRRADWEAVGGYNVNMVYGWEDWDFWLSLIQRGRKVYRIPKIHFYYRLREASMVHTMDEERQFFMRLHACLNHRDLYRNIADIEIRCKVAELYLDTGLGFGPSQVLRQIIFTDQTVIEFDLQGLRGIKQFRFDPINAPATIHLNEIKLIAEDGTSREIEDFQSNALYAKENNLIFETADPQIRFSPAGGRRPVKLVVGLNFLSVGQEVLQNILDYKNDMLNDKNDILAMIYRSRAWRLAEFFRRLVYQKILGPFPLLQQSALTISRAGFSVFYHKAKRRLKKYLWRFNDVPCASEAAPSEAAPLKTMEAKTYVRLSDFQMKADREVIRKKLRAINEEIEKKRGV